MLPYILTIVDSKKSQNFPLHKGFCLMHVGQSQVELQASSRLSEGNLVTT